MSTVKHDEGRRSLVISPVEMTGTDIFAVCYCMRPLLYLSAGASCETRKLHCIDDFIASPPCSLPRPPQQKWGSALVFIELNVTDEPDFVCTAVVIGPTLLLTAPGCFGANEAPPTLSADWAGNAVALNRYAVRAGDANGTTVGHLVSHLYVNAAGIAGAQLSVVTFEREAGAAAVGLGVLPLYTKPTSVPVGGVVLAFGPTNVTMLGPTSWSWSGVRTLAAAPVSIDSESTAAARVGACGAFRSGAALYLDKPPIGSVGTDEWPLLCGNLGDLGAPLMLQDPSDLTWKVRHRKYH